MYKSTVFRNKWIVSISCQAYILITMTVEFFPPAAGLFGFILYYITNQRAILLWNFMASAVYQLCDETWAESGTW